MREATDALEAQLTYRLIDSFERFVDDISELVHPPLAAGLLGR